MGFNVEKLIEEAERARRQAYAPYSNFSVGCAVLGSTGRIYRGCNVENASLSLSLCAERAAVANALCAGEKEILAIAVISDSNELCRPCGACRQFIMEFGENIIVIMADKERKYEVRKVKDLLPIPFKF
ncbi:MAG TPA: cytidine deaminase [Peptococcaceae bacterium]|nr:MAG: Cytidine deaminase [Clostridia bacterium 41_269]HBT20294.1 cytidine deaminase [Peptococcaceae bacterium]